MTKRNKKQVQDNRNAKKEETGRVVLDKFVKDGDYIQPPVQAKNEAQREFLRALRSHQVIVFDAPAGVGKSFLSMSEITDWIKKGYYDKLVLTRPALGMGKTLGLLPGDMRMKFEPYLLPMVDVIKSRYGVGFYECSVGNGTIEFAPLEYVRRRNIEYVCVCDESQNLTPDEAYTLITRIAEGGKLVLIGDPTQNDLRGDNCMTWLPQFVKDNPELEEVIKVVSATSDDIERGGLCKLMVKAKERSLLKNGGMV